MNANPAILSDRMKAKVYPRSLVELDDAAFWLVSINAGKRLALLAAHNSPLLVQFHGESRELVDGQVLLLCPLDAANGRALRAALPNLQPVPLGLAPSTGFGDRLGLATPGHVRALRTTLQAHPAMQMAPIFAQQSIREMGRTVRSPEQVLADATWGAFEEGWRAPLGADADHLKTPADIDRCAAAGFTFFTIDPGAFVDGTASDANGVTPQVTPLVHPKGWGVMIEHKAANLPWNVLDSSPADLKQRLAGRVVDLGETKLDLDGAQVLEAAAKYGAAVAHIVRMYRHLASKAIPCELEVSVDETETHTTPVEHVYIASELKRLGVQWVSLAPRFVGRFEKGVDYIGDLVELAEDLRLHAAVARALGPYKLSLHSGSDKFSIYPLAAQATGGLLHLKTAGTSYLEALRTLAQVEPGLFRKLLVLGIERYPLDRASYHVSAELSRVPEPSLALKDADLPGLLDQFDARQVLHVTFGSALERYGREIQAALRAQEEAYAQSLERHFIHHLEELSPQRSHPL